MAAPWQMKRVTKRYLMIANFVSFGFVLCFVLFLNLRGSSATGGKAFAWNTIHYQTFTKIPDARGVCPGLSATKKPSLVISRVSADGDKTWLKSLSKYYHICVYTVDASIDKSSIQLQVPANRGHEAMAYLTFMIDNYADMPAAAVFVHGNRFAWHNDEPDYDNAVLLRSLNISAALAPHGYHNLRCDWSASTCSPREAPPQGSLETKLGARLQPWDARAVSDATLPEALVTLFGGGNGQKLLLGRSDAIRSQCCAQFVVSRERIWQHSRDEYIALRQWLLDGSNGQLQNRNAAPADDRIAGRIVSYLWHILFMQGPDGTIDLDRLNVQACPRAQDCYCRLYGRCDLGRCTDSYCQGQYFIPQGFRLPDNWETMHPGLV